MNKNLKYIQPKTPSQLLEREKKQLSKLLKKAKQLTPIIEAEDKGQTDQELDDHFSWINNLKEQIKRIENEQARVKING